MKHLGKTPQDCKQIECKEASFAKDRGVHLEGALRELEELLLLHTNENWTKNIEWKKFYLWANFTGKSFQKYCAELVSKTLEEDKK